jgi:hypothetical protein
MGMLLVTDILKGVIGRNKMNLRKIIITLMLLLVPSIVQGETINALSCSQTDVQTAIDSASEGYTVYVPSGKCTWGTSTNLTLSKAITLQGAGIGNTVITDGSAPGHLHFGLAIDASSMKDNNIHMRLTGFTFTGPGDNFGIVNVKGPKDHFWIGLRIDHNDFITTSRGQSIRWSYGAYGVVDHNTFETDDYGIVAYTGISVYGLGHAAGTELSFRQANPQGTANAVYIEDNTFTCPATNTTAGSTDAHDGSHVVIRYNTFTNCGSQTHDTAYSGNRGQRHIEIYNNTYKMTAGGGGKMAKAIVIRAGTGVIHDNIFAGNGRYKNCVMLQNLRTGDPRHTIRTHWGWCSGVNTCDGNDTNYGVCSTARTVCTKNGDCPGGETCIATGYPCLDQIGRILDTDTDAADRCYQGGAGGRYTSQPLDPLYAWNNRCYTERSFEIAKSSPYSATINVQNECNFSCSVTTADRCHRDTDCPGGESCVTTAVAGHKICDVDVIKANRDYYDSGSGTQTPKPGYSTYTYPHPLTRTTF